jgi:ATP-dependent DNA helicase RecQ
MSMRRDTEWEPRFGRGKIVNMLVGSKSKEILDARLDTLTTYGLMKREGSAYVGALLRELQNAGLLVSSGGQYPTVTLTPRGEAAMRGSDQYKMRWPAPPGTATPGAGRSSDDLVSIDGLEFDEELYKKLKEKRYELAAADGVPPYVIFNNQTLEFFTRLKPTSIEAGTKIRGVGEKKAERFLPAFIEVIQAYSK